MEKKSTEFGHFRQRHLLVKPFTSSKLTLVARSLTDAAQLTAIEKLIAGKAGGSAQAAFDKYTKDLEKQFSKANPDYTKVPVVGRAKVEKSKPVKKTKAKKSKAR